MTPDSDGAGILGVIVIVGVCASLFVFSLFGIAGTIYRVFRFNEYINYEIVPTQTTTTIENGVETITIELRRFVEVAE